MAERHLITRNKNPKLPKVWKDIPEKLHDQLQISQLFRNLITHAWWRNKAYLIILHKFSILISHRFSKLYIPQHCILPKGNKWTCLAKLFQFDSASRFGPHKQVVSLAKPPSHLIKKQKEYLNPNQKEKNVKDLLNFIALHSLHTNCTCTTTFIVHSLKTVNDL